MFEAAHGPALLRDDVDHRAGVAQRSHRLGELRLLESFRHQDGDVLVAQVRHNEKMVPARARSLTHRRALPQRRRPRRYAVGAPSFCVAGMRSGSAGRRRRRRRGARVTPARCERRVERLAQVGDQVVRALDADREAQQPVGDPAAVALVLGDRAVRHARRMVDQRLDAAQAFGEREQLRALGDFERARLRAAQRHRDDAAEAAHLLARELVLRVRGQPGIEHLRDVVALAEEVRDRVRVALVLAHPHRQRLRAARDQERVERAQHRAERLLQEAQVLGDRVVVRHRRAADHVAVPADVLGRRVDHDVRAERERRLEVRRAERVVDDDQLPRASAAAPSAAMSIKRSIGLVGVSTQNIFVFGRIAARTAARSVMSTNVDSSPKRSSTRVNSRYVPP